MNSIPDAPNASMPFLSTGPGLHETTPSTSAWKGAAPCAHTISTHEVCRQKSLLWIRALKNVAPSHPFRASICEMDGKAFLMGPNH
jgi:hypothetical protein